MASTNRGVCPLKNRLPQIFLILIPPNCLDFDCTKLSLSNHPYSNCPYTNCPYSKCLNCPDSDYPDFDCLIYDLPWIQLPWSTLIPIVPIPLPQIALIPIAPDSVSDSGDLGPMIPLKPYRSQMEYGQTIAHLMPNRVHLVFESRKLPQ